jgi:protocatechuate 3,4-dioxygenase beta subunit
MRYLLLMLFIPLGLLAQARAGAGRPAGSPGGATPPPPPPPTPTADLASMEGQVSNALGGTPLRKATVFLNRQNGGPIPSGARTNYSATTDATGRYIITGIEPGTYRISAEHTGYLNMQYNARRPGGPGTALDLARAQKMTGVDFRLTPHGVIAGKITDEDGDPIQGVQIQIMRMAYNQGRKELQIANCCENTNDLGEYRMSGVQPGKYYLSAIYRNRRQITDRADESASQEDYVTTFYAGVTDFSAASQLEIGPGDQMLGINLRLAKVHTVHVTGRAVDNSATPTPDAVRGATVNVVNGQPGPPQPMPTINSRIQIRLQPRGALNMPNLQINTQVRADGSFDFASVAPGQYYLIAVGQGGGRAGAHAARLAVDVGNSNLEGVNIAINPGAEVRGHVRFDGDAPSPLPSLTVRLTPREFNPGVPQPQPARVAPDGSFQFDDVNLDLYNVAINTPSGLYLKSVRAGNADVMTSGIDLANGATSLDILLGLNPPQVTGSVVNEATAQPAAAVTVVLMPREKERQDQSYFYSSTNTDQYGNFTFGRVTPGDYVAYAWEDVQTGQWYDPDFMKEYLGKGQTLTAQENNPVTVKLTMIPAK